MEIITALIGLAGIFITASGGVVVAIINTKKVALEQSNANKKEILKAIAEVRTELNANSRATVATTRGLISNAYWQYREEKTLPEAVRRNIIDLYEAYKGIQVDGHTPNSWCDELIAEMKTWKTR